jgi:hypothetical protein
MKSGDKSRQRSIESDGYLSVRLLVVGDSGTGKTSLVYKLVHGSNLVNPKWTVGCSPEVLLHEFKRMDSNQPQQQSQPVFIEFWDVGCVNKHAESRFMFLSKLNGIILVYDCTNRKSYQNLARWIKELVQSDQSMSRSDSVQSLGLEERYSVPDGCALSSRVAAVAASRAQSRQGFTADSNFPSISASFSDSVVIFIFYFILFAIIYLFIFINLSIIYLFIDLLIYLFIYLLLY